MLKVLLGALFLCVFGCIARDQNKNKQHKLLLVSIDGVR